MEVFPPDRVSKPAGAWVSPAAMEGEGLDESSLCVAGSRLLPSGFVKPKDSDDLVAFVNAEAGTPELGLRQNAQICFSVQGGEVLRTTETIINSGDYPFLYQCARSGNSSYTFKNLSPGDYIVDLHFAEIINTCGPKGMRVFDVYIQNDKVLSELDIYSIVGSNKPLQLVDTVASVSDNGELVVRLQSVYGSASICGICIKKVKHASGTCKSSEHLICNNCANEIDVPLTLIRMRSMRDVSKYEQKIQELTCQVQYKSDECYEAWRSLTAANDQLEKLRMDFDVNLFKADSQDRALEKQAEQLRDISTKYERDRALWASAIVKLEEKIKVMRQEQFILSQEAHHCADSIPELQKMIFAVQSLVTQCEELKLKYNEEMTRRKKLFNLVIQTKGNIRVFCRCRPLNKEEIAAKYVNVVDFDAAKDGDIGIITNGGPTKKTFKFDRVFTPKDDQVDVFADTSPLVVSVLDGYNVCIFAYGQTGTGKTFTMEGIETNRGVNYRTLEELFKVAKEREDTTCYKISVSVLEVYNEQIRDLLAASSSKKLDIRQVAEGSHYVPGIVEAEVKNVRQVWEVLQAGSQARSVGSNNVNEHSSRSHCMLCIMVDSKNLLNGESTKSKLWLVDLAGSERLAKTEAQGDRLKEAQNINRSLSALGDVISALASKASHVPYRNSKLTHLLQDSLGGDSKTLMFVQISPSEKDLGETLSSLNFATRVRGVELGPAKKQVDLTGDMQKLKQMFEKTKAESKIKDESIKRLEETCQNLEGKVRNRDLVSRNQQDKVKELEESKQELRTNLDQLAERLKEKDDLSKELHKKLRMMEQQSAEAITLQKKVANLEAELREQRRQACENMTLDEKVANLEAELREQRRQACENMTLDEKVKELELKLKEREKQLQSPMKSFHLPYSPIDSNPLLSNVPPSDNILKNSNLINAANNESILLRGIDSLHEMRRKRERRSGPGEVENRPSNIALQLSDSTVQNKKVVRRVVAPLNEFIGRTRQIDGGKPMPRLSRMTRPANATNNISGISSFVRPVRDHVGGGAGKEKEKTRIWSR